MISCPDVQKKVIRSHYNVSTLFYRLLWGQHIHHGLWEADEAPDIAARQLTERMIQEIDIRDQSDVIDIGCGMGGSSIHLAKHHQCRVTGVTLSPFQRNWASLSSRWHRTSSRTKFICHDAETVEFADNSFDVAWSIECTEHLFDKPAFFRRMTNWLRPDGRVGICAWLAGDDPLTDVGRQQVYDVCEGFFCPSLGNEADYVQWLSDSGLTVTKVFDWTDQVYRTWEICRDRVNRTAMRSVAKIVDRGQLIFLDRFQTILDAYQTRAMKYGCFIAEKQSSL
ncbi:MAG: methyltransferase domain-containing protein [Planctomycetaceae bacterium]